MLRINIHNEKLRSIEITVLKSASGLLSESARVLLFKQIEIVNFVQRMWDDKEVNLYRKTWFSTKPVPEDLKFSLRDGEFGMAAIRVADVTGERIVCCTIRVFEGGIFSLIFSAPPDTVGAQFKVVEAILLQDPMADKLTPKVVPRNQLPPAYLKLLEEKTFDINDWHFDDAIALRQFVDENGNYYVLGEKDVGIIACEVGIENPSMLFCSFEEDDKVRIDEPLIQFCQRV